jgi:hypothetical protein
MIEGTEAWDRFKDAAKKMPSVPKSSVESRRARRNQCPRRIEGSQRDISDASTANTI